MSSNPLKGFVMGKTQYSALDHKYRVKVTEGRDTVAIFWHSNRDKAEEMAIRFIAMAARYIAREVGR